MTEPVTADTAHDSRVLGQAREALWQAVSGRDEYAARHVVFALRDVGVSVEDILLDVVAPVQRKVGAEWAADRLTVAQEHAATAIHERVIAALAHRNGETGPDGTAGTVAVSCVEGEWHALPARIVAEVLQQRGYRIDFLGAQVPTARLITHLHQTAPVALALSSSLPTRLPDAHKAITAAQAVGVPVLAGGAAFGADGRHARRLGADAWAPDARTAAAVLDRGLPRPRTGAVRQTVEDLPHLADQEYTLIVRRKRQLVRNTLTGLNTRLPAMRSYSDTQRERTAEDVGHIVDFLAAALYTDDADLFVGFVGWTGDILSARGVPARVLDPCLAVLEEELKDFPRALGVLAVGRAFVRGDTPPAPGGVSTA
ncbi:cobalamin B12-binding domain-containing protein [Yinghuangia sp. YIM S10712]|uniref:cobalamin B12-binding domain-containing protein n=1 Tax=Yinghuangia sp. YIM S10712 TaxID=3436930 RepID=UPI003F533992